MCGLIVLWDESVSSSVREGLAEELAERISHRGPDGRGVWAGGSSPIAMAHRRLAIQGLGPQGAQPMLARGRGVLSFIGELFDAQGLRESLVVSGARFQGNSDTEVLLHALVRWGVPAALERIRGQFAFAWYDLLARRLYLARDRVGIRPLYYAVKGPRLAVASEQKGILPLPWVDRTPVVEGVLRYLILGRTDDVPGETLLRGVRSLPPGHWAEWDGANLTVRRYHRLDAEPPRTCVRDVRRELERAVRGQLVGDVPIGVMVSGGMDSSTVAVMADHFRMAAGDLEKLHLFAYHDSVAAADERPYQQAIIQRMRSPHEIHWVSSTPQELAAELDQYVHHQEEPYGDASSYAEFCIAREARRHGVKVLLGGLGGDEVFVGYGAFLGPLLLDTLRARDLSVSLEMLRVSPEIFGGSRVTGWTFPVAAAMYHSLPGRVRNLATAFRASRVERLSMANARRTCADAWRSWHTHDGPGGINSALRGSVESWCIPRFLSHSDRMGLAHGVENRVPLLDDGLMRAAYGIPPSQRVGPAGLKDSLRKAAADLLPESVCNRAWKLGFHVPLDPYVRALEAPLREGHSRTRQLLDEGTRWEKLRPGSRWRWGMMGTYLVWVSQQPRVTEESFGMAAEKARS